ncbi:hypothetical protein ASF98_09725 [Arthrobacter sp. Leaf337]|nr:hypothetical protein ASF98_09725 [Arthrobacter sp. Leaf337]
MYADAMTSSGAKSFVDVAGDNQFHREITWLAAQDISTGWPDGSYRPVAPVNRDAMAAFMYRLLGKQPFDAPAQSQFTDIAPNNQFYKEIAWLASQGISSGWVEGNGFRTYRPLQPVNRDAMAAFMYRMAGKPEFTPPAVSPFVDLDGGNQFYKEITWLAATGISTGWSEGGASRSYRPLQAVNRDAMAAFMFRFSARDQPLPAGKDVTANLGARAAGHASALIRLTVRNAQAETVLSVNGVPALHVEARGAASTTVLAPLNNAAAVLNASSASTVRVELIATFDGNAASPGSTIVLDRPVTRADTAQGLGGASLTANESRVGLTGAGGVPATGVRGVYVTVDVRSSQDTTLDLAGQLLPVRAGINIISTVLTPSDDGSVPASMKEGSGSLRLDVRGYIPDHTADSSRVNVSGSYLPSPSGAGQTVKIASGTGAGVKVAAPADSAVLLALVSAAPVEGAPVEGAPVLAAGGAERGGSVVDAIAGAAPQLAFIPLDGSETQLSLSAGSGAATILPLGTLLAANAAATGDSGLSVQVTSPAQGATIDMSASGSLTLEGTLGTHRTSLSAMEVYVSGNLIGLPRVRQTPQGTRWTLETSVPASGSYTFEVRATDRAGARSSASISVTATLPGPTETVVAADVVVLDPTDSSAAPKAVTPDKILFDSKPPAVPGEIVASQAVAAAPNGFLRRVVSVDETAAGWVARTVPATLTEAIHQSDFDQTVVLDGMNPAAVKEASPAPGDTPVVAVDEGVQPVTVATGADVDLAPYQNAGDAQTLAGSAGPASSQVLRPEALGRAEASDDGVILDHHESLSMAVKFALETGQPKKDLSAASDATLAASKAAMKASGGIALEGNAQIGLGLRVVSKISQSFDWGKVNVTVHEFSVVLTTSTKVDVTAEAFLKVETTEALKNRLFTIDLPSQVFFIGPVPVVITNALDVSFESRFSAKASVSVALGVHRTQDIGFSASTVGGPSIKNKSTAPKTTYKTPVYGRNGDAQVAGSIEASMGPTVDAITKLYDVGGPVFVIGMQAGALGQVTGDAAGYRFAVRVFIEGELKVAVRITIPIIDKTLFDSVPLSISARYILDEWESDLDAAFPPGDPAPDPDPTPPPEEHSPGDIRAMAGGYASAYGLNYGGTVRSWGYNGDGSLGDGTTGSRALPGDVVGLTDVVAIEGGTGSAYALKSDGTVWSWGYNDGGTLGDGTTTTRLQPVQVPGLSNITSISTRYYSVYAVDADGSVWSWGHNYDGQLGDGTTTNRLLPVKVQGLGKVRSVAAGSGNAYALAEDGTVWAWGANVVGQIGDGTEITRLTPVQVVGLSNVRSVTSGWGSAYALHSDGTVWAWGYGLQGQLGDGTDQHRSTPVQVPGLSGVESISGFYSTVYALKSDGTVWGWGDTYYGQLGISLQWPWKKSLPMQIAGLPPARSVVAGARSAYALATDGTFYAWGDNGYGQLGDGTYQTRLTPVEVGGP